MIQYMCEAYMNDVSVENQSGVNSMAICKLFGLYLMLDSQQ